MGEGAAVNVKLHAKVVEMVDAVGVEQHANNNLPWHLHALKEVEEGKVESHAHEVEVGEV